MLYSIWKPIFKGSGGNKKITHWEIYNLDNFLMEKKMGYMVVYSCDICLKSPLNTTSSNLFNSKLNTVNKQVCRSCRARISEYDIKSSRICYDFIEKSFSEQGYELLTDEKDYDLSVNSSQFTLKSNCIGGHLYETTWNNWKSGRRCRICYELDRVDKAVKYKEGFMLYEYLIDKETLKTWKNNQSILNPDGLKRGKDFHLDHIYSIHDGYLNGVPVHLMSSVVNLRLIESKLNLEKGSRSDITLEQLINIKKNR